MNDKIILLTKDALRCDALPVYGNRYWKTPNIDALAERGTVFYAHHTNAPSIAMAITCMFSGLEAHELARRYYTEVEAFDQTETVFDILEDSGYACHVVWSAADHKSTYPYSKCFGRRAAFHQLDGHLPSYADELSKIADDRFFLWIHLPAVLEPRVSFGSDVDLLDVFVGEVQKRYPAADLYLSSDHGHMNLEKGIPHYGFHVYEGAVRVPFIAPRIKNESGIRHPTSHRQFKEILINGEVDAPEFIYSDTQYYLQAHRKISIISGDFKYIYNKFSGAEELYDLSWDTGESMNLIDYLDGLILAEPYRQRLCPIREMYFYPRENEAREMLAKLRAEKKRIWKSGTWTQFASKKIYWAVKHSAYLAKLLFKSKISVGKLK